jgi:tRNA pseudouridine13 synthase
MLPPPAPLPCRFRARPEDFVVEELPAFAPSGEGQHAWVWIEKLGRTTPEVGQRLAKWCGVDARGVGHAGLKDRQARARQALTLDGADPERLRGFAEPGLAVLEVGRTRAKLRPGQSRGNRFELCLRGLDSAAAAELERRLGLAAEQGFANRFGPQRLGPGERHGHLALAWLRGDLPLALDWLLARPQPGEFGALREARELAAAGQFRQAAERFPREYAAEARAARARAADPERPQAALMSLPPPQRRLLLEAGQALLFNDWLERRGPDLGRLIEGDVCQRTGSRGSFVALDLIREQPRSAAFEISACGPLFGADLFPASAAALELEHELLAARGLSFEAFERAPGASLGGDRRPGRLRPVAARLGPPGEDDLGPRRLLAFELPPGAFATALLAELTCGAALDLGGRAEAQAPESEAARPLESAP